MTVSAPHTALTPDDLLHLDEEGLFELVDGKLVDKDMGTLANKTAWIIGSRLFNHLEKHPSGDVYSEQTYQCFPHDPGLVRRPDLSFISVSRLASVPSEGHVPVAPDLAIEVISPNDKISEFDRKLQDYRAAGVKAVWVVNPDARIMRIYGPGAAVIELSENDTLTGGEILPGFSITVKDLLPSKAPS